MSTQETEAPECQERVGLKRKLTGPPRLLLGKSKSREKIDMKSQRRQRREKCCDGTPENNDQLQEDSNDKENESSPITHHSPQKAPVLKENEVQPDPQRDTLGILITLEENEGKKENTENKTEITRSTSKTTIKGSFSSLLRCVRKRKKSNIRSNEVKEDDKSPEEKNNDTSKKILNNTCNSMYEMCDTNNRTIANGKEKRKHFFTVWPIAKRSVSSSVNSGRGCREQTGNIGFQVTSQKGLSIKKIYRIFPRRKKTYSPVDQFECNAPKTSENDAVDNQLNQLSTDIPVTHKEEYQVEDLDINESGPDTFTFNAEVSINTNIEPDHIKKEHVICSDQDVSKIILPTVNEEKYQVFETTTTVVGSGSPFYSEVVLSCCSGGEFKSEFPGTSSHLAVGDMATLNNTDQDGSVENDIKCRPVITIEHAYSSEDENLEANLNESPQFDVLSKGLTMNGSWQHLKISNITNNTLHPSDQSVSSEQDHSQYNETLLIQTAISMVNAAIRGALEQLAIEQQHNQISLDHA